MAQPQYPVEMMPGRRRGMGVLVILWGLIITLGLCIVLGIAGVRVPLWNDHLHIRAAWPPVEWVAGPHERNEPR